MKIEGLAEAYGWLEQLDKEVRKVIKGSRFTSSHPERNLMTEEWERVQQLIKEYELPCYLGPEPYGFSFVVFPHKEIKGQIPPFLVAIQDSQFPIPSATKGFDGQEETLRILSEFTHSPRNTELLEWYGFDPLDRAESYSY